VTIQQSFTVEIPETKNVSILKEPIQEKKARHLAHLDASDLILWKVRLVINLNLESDPVFVAGDTDTPVPSYQS